MNNGRRTTNQPVGILAVQGDFAMHAKMLDRIGAPWKLVKHATELDEVDGLIMPGGESTTMLKFFAAEGFDAAIKQFAAAGKPVFGTCAGTILLAKDVLNPPQERLGLIDITVERNGYGRQIDSAVRKGECPSLADHPVEMVFIRAPIIRRVGEGVRVLARADGLPVMVEQANVLAATFHPELTEDETVHRYFLGKIAEKPKLENRKFENRTAGHSECRISSFEFPDQVTESPRQPIAKVLFVCVGNSCRSQMAEAFARHLGAGLVTAWSAGSHPLGVIAPLTYEVMQEKGIALDGQWSKGMKDVPLAQMDVVVGMGCEVACPVPTGFKGRVVEWNIPDPFGGDLEEYRGARDLIERQVASLLAEL